MTNPLEEIEHQLAHLQKQSDELSDVVARQDEEISRLMRQVSMLLAREAEREADASPGIPLADQKPPHW
jgi:SlyX protein